MFLKSTTIAALLIAVASHCYADEKVLSGPFYMCPDAHGAEQKARFKFLDITKMPMRIEGMDPRRVDGSSVGMAAPDLRRLKTNRTLWTKLSEGSPTLAHERGESRQLVAVCFAQTAPPGDGTDGPFIFMPSHFSEASSETVKPFDTVTIPEQTYLVLTYNGPPPEVGDMRFALSEHFWPQVSPFLGIERAIGPNIMI